MKNVKHIIFMFLIFGLQISCSTDDNSAQENPNESLVYEEILNVSYGSDANQVYDIYLPENRTGTTKIMVLVHGGGWVSGDKADMNGFKDYIRTELPDIAIVNINYRLADENNSPYPMQINDITAVVDDLKAKQATYRIGSELGFFGISAGGHLSLLWSYGFDIENNVKMVCSMVGPTNLADDAYVNSENQVIKDLIFQFGQDIDVLRNASPLSKVTSSAPPTILFYGGQDPLVPNSQGIDLAAKLTELNVTHEFTLYENEGHGWVGENILDTATKLKAFIEVHLEN